jgi:DNA polymerase sigma
MVARGIRKEINLFRKILAKRDVPVEKLILFGSHAKKLARPGSDIDLCVVCTTRKVRDPKDLQSHLNCDAGLAGLNMDIIVATAKDFRTDMVSPILHEIRTHGVEIT